MSRSSSHSESNEKVIRARRPYEGDDGNRMQSSVGQESPSWVEIQYLVYRLLDRTRSAREMYRPRQAYRWSVGTRWGMVVASLIGASACLALGILPIASVYHDMLLWVIGASFAAVFLLAGPLLYGRSLRRRDRLAEIDEKLRWITTHLAIRAQQENPDDEVDSE